MHRRTMFIPAIALLLVVSGSVVAAQTDKRGSSGVFRALTPPALLAEATDRALDFRSKHPLSSEAESMIRQAIAKLNDRSLTQATREAGPGVIPVIADVLASQDTKLRYRALLASLVFVPYNWRKEAEHAENEALLVVLYRRSLFDTDAEVRDGAVGCLLSVGIQFHRSGMPASIEPALRGVWRNDPDARVREHANLVLQDLGMIPRDPKREGFP